MISRFFSFFSILTLGGFLSLSLFASLSFAAADDNAKLKALEQAVTSPAAIDNPIVRKPRTRAIVFDNEPSAAPADPASAQAGSATPPVAIKVATPSLNCAALPPEATTTAVDFAIQFKVGSAVIAPASEPILGQIAKILALSPNKCIIVEGHTDITGNADKNIKLSHERAESVVRFMVEKTGMERNRFVPVGKGSADLLKNVAPNDPVNRRVVFKIVG